MNRSTWQAPFLGAALAGMALLGTARAAVLGIERVSENSKGVAGFAFCNDPVVSGNGRFVAFWSQSNNLVAGDTNNTQDIFVRDLVTGSLEMVSRNSNGALGNFASSQPTISSDGRFVCFLSLADNLVAGDSNGSIDVFVRDRQQGTTIRASLRSDGTEVPVGEGEPVYAAISGNATVVAMQHGADLIGPEFSEEPGGGVYVRVLNSQVTERVAFTVDGKDAERGNRCALSDDGRIVAFDSQAKNIVPGDQAPNSDVFVRDRQGGSTKWITTSRANGNNILRALSPDGQIVVFESDQNDYVTGDTNEVADVFVSEGNQVTCVSVTSGGVPGNDFSGDGAAISTDGRYVTFASAATNLVPGDTNETMDIFVRDRELNTTERVSLREDGSEAADFSVHPDMSDDGRLVVFQSPADFVGPNNNIGQVYAVELGEEAANRPPVANAPSDRTVKSKAAKAKVKLDGSGSSDPDGDKLTFRWLEGKTQIATGVKPTVKLKKGVHTITLEVRDPAGLTDTDEVVITVKKKRR